MWQRTGPTLTQVQSFDLITDSFLHAPRLTDQELGNSEYAMATWADLGGNRAA